MRCSAFCVPRGYHAPERPSSATTAMVESHGDLTSDHKATLAWLEENRDKLTRAEKDKVELEDELTDIPRLEEQVRHFKETDVPTRLSEVTRLDQLEELSAGNAVEVQLDIGAGTGTREFKKMDDLSKGQRATALLLLLVGASRAPLVIDQPEDDLDNRFVYDGIVKNLRELKGKRQIIASTHNANVPVVGDAELIVALEGSGRNGKPTDGGIGSLDDTLHPFAR